MSDKKLEDEAKAKAEAEAKAKAEQEAKEKAEAEAKAKAEQEARAKAGAEKTTAVQVRHKTQYHNYRCAGLVLTQTAQAYEVTDAQLERLKNDQWVELVEAKGAKE